MLKRDDWSPDGQDIAFVEEQHETMWIAHLDGSPSEQLPTCVHCDYPAFSPDGTKSAFSRAEDGVTATKSPSASTPDPG